MNTNHPVAAPRLRPRPEPRLARKVQIVDLKTEAAALRSEPPWKAHGHNSKTLVRRDDSRVVLLIMKASAHSTQHAHDASSTVQVEHGAVRIHLGPAIVELSEGMLISITRGTSHEIEALKDSTLVLTFAIPAA